MTPPSDPRITRDIRHLWLHPDAGEVHVVPLRCDLRADLDVFLHPEHILLCLDHVQMPFLVWIIIDLYVTRA